MIDWCTAVVCGIYLLHVFFISLFHVQLGFSFPFPFSPPFLSPHGRLGGLDDKSRGLLTLTRLSSNPVEVESRCSDTIKVLTTR